MLPVESKILIIGETFHSQSGGGITLSNLFKCISVDRLMLAARPKSILKCVNLERYNHYQLGYDENKYLWPFNLFQHRYKSGKVSNLKIDVAHTQQKKYFLNKLIVHILDYLGLGFFLSKIKITADLKCWIEENNPEFIYTQLSSWELICFVKEIVEMFNVKLIIHIMDDWPKTIVKKGPLFFYWQRKIDNKFRYLVSLAEHNLTISEAMALEYENRYGAKWIPFSNPLELDKWQAFQKTDFQLQNPIRILYAGRIGKAVQNGLLDLAQAIQNLKKDFKIEFHIYTNDSRNNFTASLEIHPGVSVKPAVPTSQIPALFSVYDLLFLPLDFDATSLEFSRLSFPTKASEYMISGTPIILYAPLGTALSKSAQESNWAITQSERSINLLSSTLEKALRDITLRKSVSKNAIAFAKLRFDAEEIGSEFYKIFKS